MKQGAGGEGERANISPVTVRRADLVDGFQRLGIQPRATVLVHSAMRTLGYVEGGGDAVEWCVRDPTLLVVTDGAGRRHAVDARPDPARGMSPRIAAADTAG